jgi:hypothetical protein
MKKLFSDPHFNVMDGLDSYIADYGKPDPIPLSMLRLMNQSAGSRTRSTTWSTQPRRKRRARAAGAGFPRWCRPGHGGRVDIARCTEFRSRLPRR